MAEQDKDMLTGAEVDEQRLPGTVVVSRALLEALQDIFSAGDELIDQMWAMDEQGGPFPRKASTDEVGEIANFLDESGGRRYGPGVLAALLRQACARRQGPSGRGGMNKS